tara:strand:+ start:34037 stop:35209 length:1173 start_codon:yes stop_codon:yes gene_type:complete
MNKDFNNWLINEVNGIKKKNLHRKLIEIESSMSPEISIGKKKYIQFASNNYLGMTTKRQVISRSSKILEKYGTGTGGSRLVTGTSDLHNKLERKIAKFKKTQDAIIFSSGYLANIGVISSIARKGDLIFSDELNHASLIDGARMSKANIIIYRHCDMTHLEDELKKIKSNVRKIIITDSVFSMDGDIAPLDEIVSLSKRYNCISMIDEAHATGVLGKDGSGASEMFGVQKNIDICMGTLSKAVGSVGGYVAGSKVFIDFLKNRARSFIFDTSLPASNLMTSIVAIENIQKSKKLREKLFFNINSITNFLKENNFEYVSSGTPIIPIIFGSEIKTLKISKFLFDNGIYIPAVRPPSVPKGSSRIRITLMSNHTLKHINKLKALLKKLKAFR